MPCPQIVQHYSKPSKPLCKKIFRDSNQLMNTALRNCFTKNASLIARGCNSSRRTYTDLALLSDEHRMMRETCRDFANNELVPIAGVTDKEHKFPSEAIKGMGDLGLLSVAIDSEYGGTGLDYVAYAMQWKKSVVVARRQELS